MNQYIEILKALSNEQRLNIMILLFEKTLCVCEIERALDLPQYQVSKHLRILRELGLIESTKKEKYAYYNIIPSTFLESILLPIKDDEEYQLLMKTFQESNFTCE